MTDSEPESEPEPEPDKDPDPTPDEARAPEPASPRPDPDPELKPTTWRLKLARLMLAPLLCTAAVGVHWWLNVPEHPVRSNKRDQGAKKKKKRKKKGARAYKPRQQAAIDRLWKRYRATDFEIEPINGKWSRRTQPFVNRAVVVARKHAFDGAPEEPRVVVTNTECRTIRCRFVLRSPFDHEVELMTDTLGKLLHDTDPMWMHFEHAVIEPPSEDAPKDDHYVQVTVAFAADDIDSKLIEVGEDATAGKPPAEKGADEKGADGKGADGKVKKGAGAGKAGASEGKGK